MKMKSPLFNTKLAGGMDRSTVMDALKAVNDILSHKGLHETVMVTGGAAIMFLFPDFDRPIKDIDGCNISPQLAEVIEQVAWEKGLSDNWFNNEAGAYYLPTAEEVAQGPKMSNLDIKCPSRNYLLCQKIMAGRTEEQANDAQDAEFMVRRMPNIREESDWQTMYRKFFGKTDWTPYVSERVNRALLRKRASGTEAGPQPGRLPEPLLTALINQSEWKNQKPVHVFSDPEEELNGVKKTARRMFEWPKLGSEHPDDRDEYWGDEGSGVVFFCPKTQRVLLALRSDHVNEPGTWGTWGGAIEEGESPRDAAVREAREEAGIQIGDSSVIPVWTYHDHESDFKYHNFVAIVQEEFKPRLNWETASARWHPATSPPSPPHFGLKALWAHLKRWVEAQGLSVPKLASQDDLIEKAAEYAREKHSAQKRKWTGSSYFDDHLEPVAATVKAVGGSAEMVAAAYLHDTIEDQGVTAEEIRKLFGPEVARLVVEMTQVSKLEDGNRKVRKEIDRVHYSQISPEGQTIKLADLLNNCQDIATSNPAFARTYLPEAQALLDVLTSGSSVLQKKLGAFLSQKK